jgi:hypothetical protein
VVQEFATGVGAVRVVGRVGARRRRGSLSVLGTFLSRFCNVGIRLETRVQQQQQKRRTFAANDGRVWRDVLLNQRFDPLSRRGSTTAAYRKRSVVLLPTVQCRPARTCTNAAALVAAVWQCRFENRRPIDADHGRSLLLLHSRRRRSTHRRRKLLHRSLSPIRYTNALRMEITGLPLTSAAFLFLLHVFHLKYDTEGISLNEKRLM